MLWVHLRMDILYTASMFRPENISKWLLPWKHLSNVSCWICHATLSPLYRPTSSQCNKLSVRDQPLSYDYCNHRRVWSVGFRVQGMSHSPFSCHKPPPQRLGLHWLTGVSNDSSSKVMSQHKHTGPAQLHADLTSLRIPSFCENFHHSWKLCRCSACEQKMLINNTDFYS